jgi:hypothetical protein
MNESTTSKTLRNSSNPKMVLLGPACVLALAYFALRVLIYKESKTKSYFKCALGRFSKDFSLHSKRYNQVKLLER